jgi:hypothetical protein
LTIAAGSDQAPIVDRQPVKEPHIASPELFGPEPGVRRCRYCLRRREDDEIPCRRCGTYFSFRDGVDPRLSFRRVEAYRLARHRRDRRLEARTVLAAMAPALLSGVSRQARAAGRDEMQTIQTRVLRRVEPGGIYPGWTSVRQVIREVFRTSFLWDQSWEAALESAYLARRRRRP